MDCNPAFKPFPTRHLYGRSWAIGSFDSAEAAFQRGGLRNVVHAASSERTREISRNAMAGCYSPRIAGRAFYQPTSNLLRNSTQLMQPSKICHKTSVRKQYHIEFEARDRIKATTTDLFGEKIRVTI